MKQCSVTCHLTLLKMQALVVLVVVVVSAFACASASASASASFQPGDVVNMSCVTCESFVVVESVQPHAPSTERYLVRFQNKQMYAPWNFAEAWCKIICNPCLKHKVGDMVAVQSEYPWVPFTITAARIVAVDVSRNCARPYRVVEVWGVDDKSYAYGFPRATWQQSKTGWIGQDVILDMEPPRWQLPRFLNRSYTLAELAVIPVTLFIIACTHVAKKGGPWSFCMVVLITAGFVVLSPFRRMSHLCMFCWLVLVLFFDCLHRLVVRR